MVSARLLLLFYLALSAIYAFAGEAEWKAHMEAGASAYRAGDYHIATTSFEAAFREAQSLDASDPRLAHPQ